MSAISEVHLLKRFTLIISLLPVQAVDILRKGWKRDLPVIVTNQKEIDTNPFGYINKAGTVGGLHYYSLRKLRIDELDCAILEESAHDYLMFTNKHSLSEYQYGSDVYRIMVEYEAKQLALRWKSHIQNHPDFRADNQLA